MKKSPRSKTSKKYLTGRQRIEQHKIELSKTKLEEWKNFKDKIIDLSYTKKPNVPKFSARSPELKHGKRTGRSLNQKTSYNARHSADVYTNPLKESMTKYLTSKANNLVGASKIATTRGSSNKMYVSKSS